MTSTTVTSCLGSRSGVLEYQDDICWLAVNLCHGQGRTVMTAEEELEMKKLRARVHVLFEQNWRPGGGSCMSVDLDTGLRLDL